MVSVVSGACWSDGVVVVGRGQREEHQKLRNGGGAGSKVGAARSRMCVSVHTRSVSFGSARSGGRVGAHTRSSSFGGATSLCRDVVTSVCPPQQARTRLTEFDVVL